MFLNDHFWATWVLEGKFVVAEDRGSEQKTLKSTYFHSLSELELILALCHVEFKSNDRPQQQTERKKEWVLL